MKRRNVGVRGRFWSEIIGFIGTIGVAGTLAVGSGAVWNVEKPSVETKQPENSLKTVVVRVATDSENVGFEAFKAFDGDASTFWHSQFSDAPFAESPIPISCGYSCGCVAEHAKRKISRGNDATPPFELRVDLGDVFELTGFVYRPRNDGQTNGRVGEYQLFAAEAAPELASNAEKTDVSATKFDENGVFPVDWGTPAAFGTFDERPETLADGTRVDFAAPIRARYVVFRAKTSLNGERFEAVAELELLADGVRFLAEKPSEVGRSSAAKDAKKVEKNAVLNWIRAWKTESGASAEDAEREAKICADSPYFNDLIEQFNRIVDELERPEYYRAISNQLPTPDAAILPTDRDSVDVVFRRTRALWLESNGLDASFFDETNGANASEKMGKSEKKASAENFAGDRRFWNFWKKTLDEIPVSNLEKRFQLYLSLSFLRRSLLFARPELDFERLLFVKRNRSRYNHLCDQFYGRSAEPGGGLFVLENPFAKKENDAKNDGANASPFETFYRPIVRDLLADSTVGNESRLKGQKLTGGAFLSPELSFDGEKIAFAYCECSGSAQHVETLDLGRGHTEPGRCYHLFRCNVDGSNLEMITDGTWNDFDPCFLPNGRLAFISERRNGYLRCGRDCPTYTLFDANPDGSKIRCLSYHETNEWAPSVANDGQIVWTRWDYIDRFGCIAHGAWTTTPDGRNPRAICGNYAPRHLRPDSVLDLRSIPDSPNFLATAGPHHGQSFGSIVKIDPRAPDDPASPIIRMTPDVGFPESQNGSQIWGTPWPLAEDLFLAVADYSIDRAEGREGGAYRPGNYGIYLVDAFGNRELIYRDPELGASTPIPLIARETPPEIPTLIPESEIEDRPFVSPPAFDGERSLGVVSIQNVYATDRPFPSGTKISAIRVIQVFCMSVPSGNPPCEIGVRERTATDSVRLARRVWGTAPVEEDGSACFYVPADCEIYFQALDENGLAVQSMRSGTALRPNERLSCVGCHEPRSEAPPTSGFASQTSEFADASPKSEEGGAQIPLALRREPSRLTPEGPGTQPVNFPELVQPILDERCVECHSEPDSQLEGAPNLKREPTTNDFYASYSNLVGGGFAFVDYVDPLRTIPGEFGARASVLYSMLSDHYDVALTDAERRRIALWLDTTSLFYGVYEKNGCEKEFRGERAVPTLE